MNADESKPLSFSTNSELEKINVYSKIFYKDNFDY